MIELKETLTTIKCTRERKVNFGMALKCRCVVALMVFLEEGWLCYLWCLVQMRWHRGEVSMWSFIRFR